MLTALMLLSLPVADTLHLRVISINDFHGQLVPATYAWSRGRPVGGVSALRQLMDSLEQECGCPTLRIDAGDEMQGTLLSNLVAGRSSVEGMNLLGIDIAAVGNHDLDWGQDSLRARQRDARYPWVAANVFDSVTGRRPDWARPYQILPIAGMRVAVIGYVTRDTKSIVRASRVAGLVTPGGIEPIRDALEDAHRANPDFTILVAHAGAFCDNGECSGEIVDLARALPAGSIDLIVSGHTHSLVNTVVNGIPIVQSLSNARAVGVTDFVKPDGELVWASVRVDTVWAERPRSAVAARLLEAYEPQVEALANRVITVLADSLMREGRQYALGNLLADALREVGQADIGLINNTGIRSDLPAGPVTYGQLFQVEPFENHVVRVTLSGENLQRVLEHAVSRGRIDVHVSGVRAVVDLDQDRGQRLQSVTLDSGKPLDPTAMYTLAIGNFLKNGGSGYSMLVPLRAVNLNILDLDLTIAYLQSLPRPVHASSVPRITER